MGVNEPSTSSMLLERLRQPTAQDAWERFVQLYTPLLYCWAGCLGVRGDDADNLVQEVFATLLVELPKFQYDAGKSFRGWLRTITRNKWFELQRRAKQVPPADDAALQQLTAKADHYWETDYQKHLVNRALELMRADFQETTWKACWEVVACDRPAAEVADELGITVGAVHAARFRVLARLREELAGMMD
jgi:RNA polymerase sigma-70 factor (ECF subfamily)